MIQLNKAQLLQSAIYQLFNENGFYGGLLQELTIKWTDQIPTAAICYNKHKQEFQILLGNEWYGTLPLEQRAAVLKHEILHFTNGHLIRFPWNESTSAEDKMKYNLAGDMAINQFIQNLPEGCIDVTKWKQVDSKTGIESPFPLFQSMEVYYDLIKDNWDKNKELLKGNQNGKGDGKVGPGSGQGILDQHDWEQLTDEEKKDMLKETKKIFERTLDKQNFSYDAMPGYIKDLLKEVESQINGLNYKKILRDTIKRTVCSTDRQNTWNRRNKRYDIFAPGTQVGKTPECVMYMDSSGSISHTEVNEMLQCVSGFLKAGTRKCKIGLWHTELYYMEKYKLNNKLEESVFQSGGTDVNPVIEHVKQTNPNLSIIYTDGFFSAPSVSLPKQTEVLWIITKQGNNDKSFLDSLPGRWIKMS